MPEASGNEERDVSKGQPGRNKAFLPMAEKRTDDIPKIAFIHKRLILQDRTEGRTGRTGPDCGGLQFHGDLGVWNDR